jgi:hypothetical protein
MVKMFAVTQMIHVLHQPILFSKQTIAAVACSAHMCNITFPSGKNACSTNYIYGEPGQHMFYWHLKQWRDERLHR